LQAVDYDNCSDYITRLVSLCSTITQDRISRSRLAGDPPDAMISPRLGKIGLFDFHRAAEIIEQGELAAERAIDDITAAIAACPVLR
jgi:NTE family protein